MCKLHAGGWHADTWPPGSKTWLPLANLVHTYPILSVACRVLNDNLFTRLDANTGFHELKELQKL